jgi:hypothetical protein
VTLASFYLLASYSITALFAAHRRALDRLRIHHARAGLGIPPQAYPEAFSDGPVDPLPSAIDPPGPEIVVDSLYANGKKVGEGLPARWE